MSLIVKMMSAEDMPDTSPYKGFKLITVPAGGEVTFGKSPDDENKDVVMIYIPGAAETDIYEMTGNVYVLNENGKTVASRGTNNNDGDAENFLKEFGERLGGFAKDAVEKVIAYADKASVGGNQMFLEAMGKWLLSRIEIGDPGVLKLLNDMDAAMIGKLPDPAKYYGQAISKLEFGTLTEMFWHAANAVQAGEDNQFLSAMGEFLANLVMDIPDFPEMRASARKAVLYARDHINVAPKS